LKRCRAQGYSGYTAIKALNLVRKKQRNKKIPWQIFAIVFGVSMAIL
jgi:hypothetical protein